VQDVSLMARLSLALGLALAACGHDDSSASRALPTTWSRDTLAAVNGTAITAEDVELARTGGHGGAATERDALDGLVRDELAAQRAAELGLDHDPAYQAELRSLEARVAAFRRQRLADAYYQHLADAIAIDDTEARRYFEAHAAAIRTQVHVQQILTHDRAVAEQAAAELAAGASFDEVARPHLPAIPGEQRPWDLGFLRWNQVPEAWRPVLDTLAVGATSGVIAGPRGRYWVIQLIERREDPAISFDTVKDTVMAQLRATKASERRAAADRDLATRARLVLTATSR